MNTTPEQKAWVQNYIRERVTVTPKGCWEWRLGKNHAGYGHSGTLMRRVGTQLVHRATYIAFRGPVPDGLHCNHLCRNRACCNPAHIEPVTPHENALRGEAGLHNAIKTHCPRGHEYDEANTYCMPRSNGIYSRRCRTCDRDGARGRREKKRAQKNPA